LISAAGQAGFERGATVGAGCAMAFGSVLVLALAAQLLWDVVSFLGLNRVRCRRFGMGQRWKFARTRQSTAFRWEEKGVGNAVLHHTSIHDRWKGHRLVCRQQLPVVH
jgi:hypothetical protein